MNKKRYPQLKRMPFGEFIGRLLLFNFIHAVSSGLFILLPLALLLTYFGYWGLLGLIIIPLYFIIITKTKLVNLADRIMGT